jgi:type I restriction enzyme M protein
VKGLKMPKEYKPTGQILATGEEKKLITIRDGRITYEGTKEKKTYQFTDPEEPVRARVYVELIEKYQYPASRIDTEVYPPSRAPLYPADIVVYEDDEHESVFIVVETKATSSGNEIETGKKEGLGNANLFGANYLFVVCGEEEMAYDVKENPSLQTLESKRVSQIPVSYGKLPKYRYKKGGGVFFDLKEASLNELHNKFQRCHDEIWEGGKRDPAVSFDEMSKLMFAKIHDERFTREGEFYKFQIGTNETDFEVARRVKEIYERAQRGESGVFRELIDLSDERIYKIVEILQDISLTRTDLDAKGRAFEKFLDRYFRGSAGQYFTPRQIVDFMVEMLEPDAEDYIMDPACGSGGFLLYSLKEVRDVYGKDSEAARDFAIRHIYGIEINDRIARIAMMDMVIHHDGHTNIVCTDALQAYDTFGRREIQPNKYDLVFTNPPFGAVAKDEKILKIFELGSKHKKRKTQKTEILFIERCLDFLRPGGKMSIVLPDGILTNSSLQYVRDFIDKRAWILAVVSLPQQTFVPSGSGVKASLVFLQKKRENEELHDYPIFMAIAEHVGYDATGRPDENDFSKILEDWRRFKEGERGF